MIDNPERKILTRLLTAFTLLCYLSRWLQHTTPSQLMGPPLFNVGLDVSFWAYRLLQLPRLLVYSRTGAVAFDLITVGTGLLVILYPLKRIFIACFALCIILFAITINSHELQNTLTPWGLMVVFLPFLVRNPEKFDLAWQGMRYYACFIYLMAFIWKTCIGDAFWHWDQGLGTFQANLAEYLFLNPDTFMAGIYRWFLTHAWLLDLGHIIIVSLEGLMGIGLLTRRWDRILIWIPVFIHVSLYFFADVFTFELLALNFAFLTGPQLSAIGKKIPILTYPLRHVQDNHKKDLSLTD